MTQSISTEKLAQYLCSMKKEVPYNEPDASYWRGWNSGIDAILIDISFGKLNGIKPWLDTIAKDKVTPI
jgi:hypothetical protein